MKEYLVGVDLGRDTDPTAIAIGKVLQSAVRQPGIDPASAAIIYTDTAINRSLHIGQLEQIPLRTPYTEVADRLAQIANHQQLAMQNEMIVDATGVGQPVIDILSSHGVKALGVTITSGSAERATGKGVNVPKLAIVDSMIALMHLQKVSFAPNMVLERTLKEQLREFQMKRQANGGIKYENSLDSIHDDLVIAVGLVCWYFLRMYGAALTYVPGKGKIERKQVTDPFRGERWHRQRQKSPITRY